MIFAVYRYLICGKDAGGVLFCVTSVCRQGAGAALLHFHACREPAMFRLYCVKYAKRTPMMLFSHLYFHSGRVPVKSCLYFHENKVPMTFGSYSVNLLCQLASDFGKKAIASLPRFEYTYRDKQIKRDKPGREIDCFLWQFSRKLCR